VASGSGGGMSIDATLQIEKLEQQLLEKSEECEELRESADR